MTNEQLEKLIKVGERKKLNAVLLAQYAVIDAGLSASEATVVMRAYERKHPTSSKLQNIVKTKPVAIPASPVTEVVAVITSAPSGYTPSILNRSAVKDCALFVSDQKRGGKFKRCSPAFVKGVETELESIIRGIGGAIRGIGGTRDSDDVIGDWDFLNRKQIFSRIVEQLNNAVRKIILRKVRSYPSIGKTLK